MTTNVLVAARRLTLAAGVVLQTAGGAAAQQPTGTTTAQVVVSRVAAADALRQAGQTVAARALLEGALLGCARGADGSACRQTLDFNLGYLLQDAPDSSEARASLHDAVRFYRAALAEAPGHRATLLNLALAYTRLDAAEADPAILQQAAAADSTHAGVYLARLADVYLAHGDTAGAVRALQRAMQLLPDDPTAPARALSLYTAQGTTGVRALAQLLPAWEIRFPQLAEAGYLAVLSTARDSDAALAENALVHWVKLRAARGQLSTASLAELPQGWQPPAVVDLQSYLKDPWHPPAPANWWLRSGGTGRDVLAAAALALGEDMLGAQRPESAERCWSTAIGFSPGYSLSHLQLIRSLASLYFRVPRLDPTGEKLAAVDRTLYEEKGYVILMGNLEQIQEYHATLGLLYAERGVWGSQEPWANAIFQLSNALDAARQREATKTGFHQPLPQLREALARGYVATGQSARAAAMYLDAAKAYLDTDDLGRAAAALDSAGRLGADVQRSSARLVLTMRQRIVAQAPLLPGTSPCDPSIIGKMTYVQAAPADSDFFIRQRFKALADCASAAPPETRAAIAAAALALPAERRMTLVGAADLLRLDAAKDALLARVEVKEGDSRVAAQAPAVAFGRPIPVVLSTDARPVYVSLSKASRVALQVARTLPPTVDARLRDDTLLVAGKLTTAQAAALRQQVAAVTGARVTVQMDRSHLAK